MKLLLCERCGTLAVPMQHPYPIIYKIPVSCLCRESWCWWENPELGHLKVYGKDASVIGIANSLLQAKFEYPHIRGFEMKELIKNIPDDYLFKKYESLIIKIQPGSTRDIFPVTKEELDKQIEETKPK
jgi:hypothetical protein